MGKRFVRHRKLEWDGLNHALSCCMEASRPRPGVLTAGSSSVLAQLWTWAKAYARVHSGTAKQPGIFNPEVETRMFLCATYKVLLPGSSSPASCIGQWYLVPMRSSKILKVNHVMGLNSLRTAVKTYKISFKKKFCLFWPSSSFSH